MRRPLADKRHIGPLLDISQYSKPFTTEDGSGVVFRASLTPSKSAQEKLTEDPLAASEHIRVFLETLKQQQPELNIAGSEVLVLESSGSETVNEYQITIPMLEPILVFSHIEDAISVMQKEVNDDLRSGDHVILPTEEIRDQIDMQYNLDAVRTTFASQTIL
jgi:hypothetical protein